MRKREKAKAPWRGSWKDEIKNHKRLFIVYMVLRLLVVAVAVAIKKLVNRSGEYDSK